MRYDSEVRRAIAYWSPRLGVRLEPALVHAVIERESGHGRALVTDEPGRYGFSYGPMMVLDTTAKSYGVTNPQLLTDPAIGIHYGVRYLGEMLKRFGGNVVMAVSAYNAGPGRVGTNPDYVRAVLGFLERYRSAAAPAAATLVLLAFGAWALTRRRLAA